MKQNKNPPLKLPFYYGWMIVFLAAMTIFFSGPDQTYSISIFIDAYLSHFGWSSTLISTMYLFATLLAGFLLFIGQIGIMIMLIQTNSYPTAILFGVALGIVGGFEAISLGIVWPNYFGRANIGSIKGVAATIMVIGSAFGPLPFALAYDRFGSYQEILYMMMVFPFLALIFAFFSRKPVKKQV